jgi:hypothetical protein
LSHSELICRSSPTRCGRSGPGYTPTTRKPGRLFSPLQPAGILSPAPDRPFWLYMKSGVPYYSNWCSPHLSPGEHRQCSPLPRPLRASTEYLASDDRGLFVFPGQAAVLLGALYGRKSGVPHYRTGARPLLLRVASTRTSIVLGQPSPRSSGAFCIPRSGCRARSKNSQGHKNFARAYGPASANGVLAPGAGLGSIAHGSHAPALRRDGSRADSVRGWSPWPRLCRFK